MFCLQYQDGNYVCTLNGYIASQPRENALEFNSQKDAEAFKEDKGLTDVDVVWDNLHSMADDLVEDRQQRQSA